MLKSHSRNHIRWLTGYLDLRNEARTILLAWLSAGVGCGFYVLVRSLAWKWRETGFRNSIQSIEKDRQNGTSHTMAPFSPDHLATDEFERGNKDRRDIASDWQSVGPKLDPVGIIRRGVEQQAIDEVQVGNNRGSGHTRDVMQATGSEICVPGKIDRTAGS